jgi:NDP-sugar pyrophosphorylase family protein
MPIGSMPILEVVLRQLRRHGFSHVTLAVGYLSQLIMAYFGNGSELDLGLEYSRENEPLGTAGPLRLVTGLESPFLVMNGDILTTLDYWALVAFHRDHEALATVAVHPREVRIDLGVVELNEKDELVGYSEKPVLHHLASMGVYVLDPRVLSLMPQSGYLDLPDLMRQLIAAGERVVAYRHAGYWMDIGRADDYEQAAKDFERDRARFLPG